MRWFLWVFYATLWLGCTKSEPAMCPDGYAMTADGSCAEIAGDDGPGDSDSADDLPADDDPADDPEDTGSIEISTDGLVRLQTQYPTAVGFIQVSIPESLNTAHDVEHGNDEIGVVVDSEGRTLGFIRHIFTPVFCVAGVCEAVQFMMAFDPLYVPAAVYHPNDLEHKLMKYFDGYYLEFDTEDMVLLNEVFVTPPSVYEGVEDVEALVEGTHGTAPTLPAFQEVTVRGAVFTVWYIIRYGQQTQSLLESMNPAGMSDG